MLVINGPPSLNIFLGRTLFSTIGTNDSPLGLINDKYLIRMIYLEMVKLSHIYNYSNYINTILY